MWCNRYECLKIHILKTNKKNPSQRSLLCRSDLVIVAVVLSFDLPWLLSVLFPLFKTETFQGVPSTVCTVDHSKSVQFILQSLLVPPFIGCIFLSCRLQDNISRTYF